MEQKQLLTNSSLTTLKICPRKYRLMYEEGIRPAQEPEYFKIGKIMHKMIEVWALNGRSLEKALLCLEQAISGQDYYLEAKLQVMIEGYHEKYQNEPYEIIPELIEKPFVAPLINPETMRPSPLFDLAGQEDMIIKDRAGRLLIKETKTTVEDLAPESDYWRKLLIDSQISQYYVGANALGLEIEHCLYDVIKKPQKQPLKATPMDKRQYKKDGTLYASQRDKDETPEEYYTRVREEVFSDLDRYYARKEVPRLESDLMEFMFDAWVLAQTLRMYQLRQRWPRNTNSCVTMLGTCSMYGICTGMVSKDDPSQFKKVTEMHQELKKTA